MNGSLAGMTIDKNNTLGAESHPNTKFADFSRPLALWIDVFGDDQTQIPM